tara:strand:+ start:1423 stop:1956 length:534 start_codon:yes stop_codon:yes gene_type:complete
MGKVKTLETPVNEKKVERVLGGDIETSTFEELGKKFEKIQKEFDDKTYGISFTQDSIALLTMEILPKVEWTGQQAWDVAETQKLVSELKPDVVINTKKESIRALFQFVATNKYVGVDHVYQVSQLLTTLAEVIQNQIGKDEQVLRDAGFELQAAEMGITPETAMQEAIAAKTAEQTK